MKTIFEGNGTIVQENGSGEIFVTSQNKMVTVRVNPSYDSISITAAGNNISPWAINGLPAVVVN